MKTPPHEGLSLIHNVTKVDFHILRLHSVPDQPIQVHFQQIFSEIKPCKDTQSQAHSTHVGKKAPAH